MRNEAQAFRLSAMPCNPRPFARALSDAVGADVPIASDECKAILWVLLNQAYGELATVNLFDEWERLDAAIPKGGA